MATQSSVSPAGDAEILSRLIRTEDDNLQAEAAEALLSLRFGRRDLDRIHELVTRNQDDELTHAERAEMESYLRVSSFLDLLHSKARRSLKHHA